MNANVCNTAHAPDSHAVALLPPPTPRADSIILYTNFTRLPAQTIAIHTNAIRSIGYCHSHSDTPTTANAADSIAIRAYILRFFQYL